MTPSDISTNAGFRVVFLVCHLRIAPAPVSFVLLTCDNVERQGRPPENMVFWNHGYVLLVLRGTVRFGVRVLVSLQSLLSLTLHDGTMMCSFLAAFERACLGFQAPQHSPIATVSVIERISYVFDPIDWSLANLWKSF